VSLFKGKKRRKGEKVRTPQCPFWNDPRRYNMMFTKACFWGLQFD
jgi:hypothetical protein